LCPGGGAQQAGRRLAFRAGHLPARHIHLQQAEQEQDDGEAEDGLIRTSQRVLKFSAKTLATAMPWLSRRASFWE